ncbi:MAG TPA: hypothetical protein VER96_10275 [Polyangiaceae bacterium]|nr:hypothetical protein [Polyangiaceae bacterium]
MATWGVVHTHLETIRASLQRWQSTAPVGVLGDESPQTTLQVQATLKDAAGVTKGGERRILRRQSASC